MIQLLFYNFQVLIYTQTVFMIMYYIQNLDYQKMINFSMCLGDPWFKGKLLHLEDITFQDIQQLEISKLVKFPGQINYSIQDTLSSCKQGWHLFMFIFRNDIRIIYPQKMEGQVQLKTFAREQMKYIKNQLKIIDSFYLFIESYLQNHIQYHCSLYSIIYQFFIYRQNNNFISYLNQILPLLLLSQSIIILKNIKTNVFYSSFNINNNTKQVFIKWIGKPITDLILQYKVRFKFCHFNISNNINKQLDIQFIQIVNNNQYKCMLLKNQVIIIFQNKQEIKSLIQKAHKNSSAKGLNSQDQKQKNHLYQNKKDCDTHLHYYRIEIL
ncbi:unnamed protein product [Paramecium sonneborni]|uniref:Transmembrane protein n=1 Tax=Paramecium sonneborni TaxID=65129 RepID=A0A8S1RJ51_9CILI|nr:unnamed protein product [Paramecium sonneborni]